ncbi:hypothetical protein [Streptomyces spiralis]|uniref:hypothetical protein n=1 Tax=Streptomyces spiralis TaxID=66376 RepID=UPI00340B5788
MANKESAAGGSGSAGSTGAAGGAGSTESRPRREAWKKAQLEGEPERVIKAGETFWEPGGDVIHHQDGNNRADSWSRFLFTMMCAPGQPMLTLVDDEELARREHLRAPRPGT